MPSIMLPVKEDAFANRLDERSSHKDPVSRACRLCSLPVPSEHFIIKSHRRKKIGMNPQSIGCHLQEL